MKLLSNMPDFWNTKSHVVIFHFVLLFPPNECPSLNHKGLKLNEKYEKKQHGFLYSKNIVNFELFY